LEQSRGYRKLKHTLRINRRKVHHIPLANTMFTLFIFMGSFVRVKLLR
jgi:hypothetical protein